MNEPSTNTSNIRMYVEQAVTRLTKALERIDNEPALGVITDLIEACEEIDRHYKAMCDETDDYHKDPVGTSYENGINIEFYIETSWWHTISLALRKLREIENAKRSKERKRSKNRS